MRRVVITEPTQHFKVQVEEYFSYGVGFRRVVERPEQTVENQIEKSRQRRKVKSNTVSRVVITEPTQYSKAELNIDEPEPLEPEESSLKLPVKEKIEQEDNYHLKGELNIEEPEPPKPEKLPLGSITEADKIEAENSEFILELYSDEFADT